MKKKFRRVISWISAISLMFALTVPCFAATQATYQEGEPPVTAAPRVYEVCNGKPYHELVSHCWGTGMVDGKAYVEGCAWQCSGCNYVMVTEGDPLIKGDVIGKWAGAGWSYKLNAVTYVVVYSDEHGVCNSAKMSGYKFVNA